MQNPSTTSTEFPTTAMDTAASKRPVADPEGPILELLRVPRLQGVDL